MNGEIGKEISAKRKEKGLTQADIAAQFGISVQAVSKWERGLSKPRYDIFDKLVDYLGLEVEIISAEKKNPWFTRFISAFCFEAIKTICIGVMMASSVCVPLRFLSTETAITLIGVAASVFCLASTLKRA